MGCRKPDPEGVNSWRGAASEEQTLIGSKETRNGLSPYGAPRSGGASRLVKVKTGTFAPKPGTVEAERSQPNGRVESGPRRSEVIGRERRPCFGRAGDGDSAQASERL